MEFIKMDIQDLQYHAFRAIRGKVNGFSELSNDEVAGFVRGVSSLERLLALEAKEEIKAKNNGATADEKLNSIGFEKKEENEYIVSYERYEEVHNFFQRIDILHKNNGKTLIQSYDRDLFDTKGIGNTCVGLTYEEAELLCQKIRELGW